MEIIIDYFDINSYANSSYKGFYYILSKVPYFQSAIKCDSSILSELLWQNKSMDLNFVFVGFDLNKILTSKDKNDIEWKKIFSAINTFVVTYPNNTLTYKNCNGKYITLIVIDKNHYKSYGHYSFKGFYEDVFSKLNGKSNVDFADFENCNYNADLLNEFLWYNRCENIKFTFVNFNLTNIKTKKNYDNYEWGLILDVVSEFVKNYPNNTLEFIP